MVTKNQKDMLRGIDGVSGIKCHRDGTVTAFHSYFYRTMTRLDLWERILKVFSNAKRVEDGDHYHDFVGGSKAGGSTDSYIWVRFELPTDKE